MHGVGMWISKVSEVIPFINWGGGRYNLGDPRSVSLNVC